MLTRARKKSLAASRPIELAAADALRLPFTDDRFDRATVAFGVRNLEDLTRGLVEIRRVLKPGGCLAILEFSHPQPLWLRAPYRIYLDLLLPAIGGLLSSKGDAYRYLAESIRGFPEPETLVAILGGAGFRNARYIRLSGGIVAVHTALK
jgi:demethylmenaquinone methyltransferase/2-methoxy-6-polyprenyl-1,4-benzoquinol methylase